MALLGARGGTGDDGLERAGSLQDLAEVLGERSSAEVHAGLGSELVVVGARAQHCRERESVCVREGVRYNSCWSSGRTSIDRRLVEAELERGLLAHDLDVVAPAAAGRAGARLAHRVRRIDHRASGARLDRAARSTVDHLEVVALAVLVAAAADDRVAAEARVVGRVVARYPRARERASEISDDGAPRKYVCVSTYS